MAGHNLQPVFIELDVERYRVIPRRSCGSSLSDQPARTSSNSKTSKLANTRTKISTAPIACLLRKVQPCLAELYWWLG